jgi:hypothetical protein
MANNQPPTQEEVDRMVELYEELDSKKAVAEHEDIDYSRTTVTKWINRRLEEEEDDTEDEPTMGDDPFSAGPDDEPVAEPEGDYTAEEPEPEPVEDDPDEEDFSDILVDEPPEPNEILLDVLETAPGIKEKHAKYVQTKFDQYGQMAPSDLVSTLNQIKITNKNQVIRRVKENYEQRINTRQRREDDITQYEPWATLFTKITGDPSYIQQAEASQDVGGGSNIQAPPVGGQGGQQQGGGVVTPAHPSGSHTQTTRPDQNQQRAQPQAAPQQNGRGQMAQTTGVETPPPSGGSQGSGELDPFQQKLLELLEENMDDGGNEQPQPAQAQSEPRTVTDQLEELAEIQETVKSLSGASDNEEANAQLEATLQQLNSRINELAAKVNEDGGQQVEPRPDPSGGDDGGMIGQIAALAQSDVDAEIIETLMEMETDPDVLEAKAKREEIENETAWKTELARSLSPGAVEKGVEMLSNFSAGIAQAPPAGQGGQQAQAQQPQQQQAQPRQAQQQPQQQPRQVEQAEQTVERADPQPAEQPDTDEDTSSPLRKQGREELNGSGADEGDDEEEPDGEDADGEAEEEQ